MQGPLPNALHAAILLIHSHDEPPFHLRLFRALDTLFTGSKYALELFGRDGSYTLETNLPFDECHEPGIHLRTEQLVRSQSPMFQRLAAGDTDVMRLSDFITIRELRRTDLYHEIFRKIGISRQIGIPIQSAYCLGGLTINRDWRDYSPEDLALAAALAPQVAKAFEVHCLLRRLQAETAQSPSLVPSPMRRTSLSRRESEVLLWIAEGKRDAEIATILGTSVRTINQHVRAILRKLEVETRTAAVTVALKTGMLGA